MTDAVKARVRRLLGAQIPTLDGVRGLAILLVLGHNLNVLRGPQTAPAHAFDFIDDLGWVGVQLFFVLSGFLITGALLDTKTSDNYYRAFYGRRVLRIFPLYYAALFVAFVLAPLLVAHPPDRTNQLWLWTYLSNWTSGNPDFPHFWSLAVEEQFYLVWPFVVRALAPRRLLQLTLVIIVVAFVVRVGLRLGGADPRVVYEWTICRMDALAAGAAVATAMRLPILGEVAERWRGRIGLGAIAVAAVGFVVTRGNPRTTMLGQTVGYTVLAASFAVLVFAAVYAQADRKGILYRGLDFAPLRAFGKYSYGIYVIHMPIHRYLGLPLLARLEPGPSIGGKIGMVYLVAVTAVTFGCAAVSYHLFEQRFLRMKRYFVPSRKQV